MRAYLMCAPRFEVYLEKRHTVSAAQSAPVGDGTLTALADLALYAYALAAANGCVNNAAAVQNALAYRVVGLFDAAFHHVGAVRVLTYENKPGRIAVEAIDRAEGGVFAVLCEVIGLGVGWDSGCWWLSHCDGLAAQ